MTALTLSSSPVNGILLFAHGSRDPLWRGPIEAVATRIRADHPSLPVACAYLELCEPSLPQAAAQMISELDSGLGIDPRNATNSIAPRAHLDWSNGPKGLKIRIVPMFLGMGKHAREDLPEIAAELRAAHPQVDFEIAQTVGEDERVTRLLAEIAVAV
jgi:sirohydrochlorin cobaltochelatase